MTLQVVGAVCIVIALIGGDFDVGGVEIPRLSRGRIAALVTAGVILVGLGLLADAGQVPDPPQVPSPVARTTPGGP
ncbi:hypothetical protein [Actinomadura formosensis]|uniref:hypothetical protein n=1 Tax=Actinomadura formosensis TaxID=60706 RepID=UPI000833C3F1|nr:hypothetical protein [Actinomadura formosensis]